MEMRKRSEILRQEEKMLVDLPMPPSQHLDQDALSDDTSYTKSDADLDSFIKR